MNKGDQSVPGDPEANAFDGTASGTIGGLTSPRLFSLQLRGFNNQEMRALLAQLLGVDPATYPIGRMTYDLRRLRLQGIIERIPHTHRYPLTPDGLRIALFFSRTCARLLRPKLAEIMPQAPPVPSALRIAFDRLNAEIDACCEKQQLAA